MAERKENFADEYDFVKPEKWVPIKTPTSDLMGNEFPTIRINSHAFEPGFDDMVPPGYAEHINILISRVNKDAIRLLRPTADIESIRQQAGLGQAPGTSKIAFVPAT